MKHISLFSGIGGFDLAAEWMGWQNIASCEINPFSRRHLEFYWPDAYHHDDIHTLTIDLLKNELDKRFADWQSDDIILTGGFPCQPYSQAGKRLGKEDSRHLWPEMLRFIREVRPRYIVGENVGGIVNWSDGLVFEEVQVDLEAEGYQVQAFILPACAVGAPHRRDRVWFIANAGSQGLQRSKDNGGVNIVRAKQNKQPTRLFRTTWQNFPTESPVRTGNDGIPARLDGITFPKWRNESIKAAGNAIVPQVAFRIFQAIQEIHDKTITP
jgi:DNA (cytosine-5)-methyltransferase 1